MEPWRIVLKLSKLEKELDQQRRSFTVTLKPDNALDGLLALNRSGSAAEDPLMQSLNMTAIAEITADGAMDIDELQYLVGRVGALNEVYDVDEFEALMRQVEENYRGACVVGRGKDGGLEFDWCLTCLFIQSIYFYAPKTAMHNLSPAAAAEEAAPQRRRH